MLGSLRTDFSQTQFFTARQFFDGRFTPTGAGAIVPRLAKHHLLGPTPGMKILCPGATLMLAKTPLNIRANAGVQRTIAGPNHIHTPVSGHYQTTFTLAF
jgi:hypothetical protein